MAIGMTYEQYWYGDTHMARAFYKADKIRQKRMNDEAWLYGAYVARALDATICNALRKKGDIPSEYPKEPIWDDAWDDEDEREDQKREREAQETVFAEAYMMNMMLAGKDWKKPK